MDVLRYDVTNLADVNGYLDMDTSETETILTVISGRVSGELDRVVSREEDGGLVLSYQARIDGLEDGTGVARVECTAREAAEILTAIRASSSHPWTDASPHCLVRLGRPRAARRLARGHAYKLRVNAIEHRFG